MQDPIVALGGQSPVFPVESSAAFPTCESKHGHLFPSILTHPISRKGHNLSHGQRQLLQLAKAFLSRAKVVIMNEATSSVDIKTDAAIQASIRDPGSCFADSTLITIAHRLSTLVGFDLIFVMENGREAESGTPAKLMEKRGKFWSLVRESGDRRIGEIDGL